MNCIAQIVNKGSAKHILSGPRPKVIVKIILFRIIDGKTLYASWNRVTQSFVSSNDIPTQSKVG